MVGLKPAAEGSSPKPNVLFIVVDQWRGDCLSRYKGRHPILTPHLDNLGDQGVNFSRAYADCPICMPQRMTMISGQLAARFGRTGNFKECPEIKRDATLPALLRAQADYQTVAIGKLHLTPSRARYGFDDTLVHPEDYVNWLEGTPHAGQFRGHGIGGTEIVPAPQPTPERYSHTRWIVDRGIEFCYRRDPERPWYMWMVFDAPHAPYDPPDEFTALYNHIRIPEPVRGDWCDAPPPAFQELIVRGRFDRLRPEWIAESRRRYYAACTHIDYQLGRLFGELRQRGWWDNTLVIFTADHGEMLGDHGLWFKSNFLNGSARVPLAIKPPKAQAAPPQVVEHTGLALTADIVPTILDYTGVKPTQPVDGISLRPVIAGEVTRQSAPRTVYGECGGYAAALDDHHTFCYYQHGSVKHLFAADDCENLRNLWDDPARQPAGQALEAGLLKHLAGFNRPMAQGGSWNSMDRPVDLAKARRTDAAALRGPLHYGMGYDR